MKKLIIMTISVFFFVIGCNDYNSLVQPEHDYVDESVLPKGRPILNDKEDDDLFYLYDSLKYTFGENIKTGDILYSDFQEIIDDDIQPKVKTKYSKTFTVDGSKGAVLFVRKSWRNQENKKINLSAVLQVPKGAHEGPLTFDMIFDLENFAMELYPSPFSFNKPVILNMSFKNIEIPEGLEVDFTYLDGEETIEFNKAYCCSETGALFVKGPKLHHFSRYGWTRTAR